MFSLVFTIGNVWSFFTKLNLFIYALCSFLNVMVKILFFYEIEMIVNCSLLYAYFFVLLSAYKMLAILNLVPLFYVINR